jgi:hypothetical protein
MRQSQPFYTEISTFKSLNRLIYSFIVRVCTRAFIFILAIVFFVQISLLFSFFCFIFGVVNLYLLGRNSIEIITKMTDSLDYNSREGGRYRDSNIPLEK